MEYKKSLAELKGGLISIAAILNKHRHGELWFGIRNDGKAVGLDAGEKTLRDISQSIAAHIEPRIYPTVEIVSRDGAACIKVTFKGKDAPYFAYGRAYMGIPGTGEFPNSGDSLLNYLSREYLARINQPACQ